MAPVARRRPLHHPIADAYNALPFGSDRTVTIAVRDPGVYRVAVWAHTRSANGSGGRGIDSVSEPVVVTETSSDLEVHVRVSAEDVARYIANEKMR